MNWIIRIYDKKTQSQIDELWVYNANEVIAELTAKSEIERRYSSERVEYSISDIC